MKQVFIKIQTLRGRLAERNSENYTIIDQANDDIETLQQQIAVLRRQLARANSNSPDDDCSVANANKVIIVRRHRRQPQPPPMDLSQVSGASQVILNTISFKYSKKKLFVFFPVYTFHLLGAFNMTICKHCPFFYCLFVTIVRTLQSLP